MKNVLLVFVCFCCALPAFAQFSVGLSAGANVSHLEWQIKSPPDLSFNYDPALGFRFAALGEWQMSPSFALRAEFGTQVKSNKSILELFSTEPPDFFVSATSYQRFQYWEGSLLLQIAPLKTRRNLYMLTGCSAGKLTNGWYHLHDYKGTAGFKNNGKIQLNDSIYNLKSVAIDFGLGWRIPLGMKSGLKLEARYQYGLTDFSSHKNVDARFDPLIFSVGYLYKI